MPAKKKAEAESEPEAAPEPAEFDVTPVVRVLGPIGPALSVPTSEEFESMKRQLEDLRERFRAHLRAHHKYAADVWQF